MAEHHGQTPVESIRGSGDIRGSAGFILTGLSGGHSVFHWLTQSFLVMLPEVKAAFALSNVQVGSIISIRQMASGLITLPGGILSDMLRRQWGVILALCMAGFGVGWLVMGVSPIFPVLLLGLVFVAVSASIWHLPAMASLSHHFSHRRGTALSLHGVGGSIGEVFGPIVTGFLLGVLTWRGVLSVYSAAPVLLAVGVYWAFRDIGKTEGIDAAKPDTREQLRLTREVLKNPTLWAINLLVGMRGMAHMAFVTFLPIYLEEEINLGAGTRGLYIGLLTLVGILATPATGYLSDRLGRKLIVVPGLLWLSALSWLLVPSGSGVMLTAVIVLLGLFLFSDQPILTAAALDIVGRNVATTILGVLSFSRFGLSAVSPIFAGWLSDNWGIEAVFQYVAILYAVAAVILLALRLDPAGHAPHEEQGRRPSHL